MTKRFSRRSFLTLTAASLATPSLANAPSRSLRPVLRPSAQSLINAAPTAESLIRDSGLSGKISYAVARAGEGGGILEGHNAAAGLPPASVTKVLTALYALHYLGPTHRFVTSLVAVGTVQNGVLKGDLVLRGGGDPTLDTNRLADLARTLKASGIREVTGRFLVWGGALPATKQIDDKQPAEAGYNPAVSGLALNYNRVHFEWKRSGNGYGVTMDARSDRYRPAVTVAEMKIENRAVPVYTYKSAGKTDQWTVARGALGNGGARWLPVRQPELYAGEVFRTLARAHGVQLKAPKVARGAPRGTIVARQQSPDLRTILKGMLKYSTNLTAEMVGLAASQARGAQPASLRQSAGAMNAWAKEQLGMQAAALVDHSGLGEASRLRADETALMLAKAGQHAVLQPILKDIPLRDENGRPIKSHPVKVKAKTGTLHFVSALAGYLNAPDGKVLAFAIFEADVNARARLIGPNRERPKGARTWNGRAKRLQQALIARWGTVYGA
ncbi:D-alanyl-D-alanine carboxypeptidase/D-alanyl-D-alanine-endopeptidase [Shimia sp. R10_1]|uniref:D-alanyl-D-alanine carboxypeptidase/D-alanyl-D-alanine endopeptidase n=1 Tax=Shimia sp. R10_1 TaxID=2821095 RepID=UPI001ADD4C18|nr:D-alanyl-D-alanine carboxypeptidase/D-alanyl-D-alanine-endopeptidase [Shimia sp. R10_1]MBO9474169.1 D-alanyl-D-alanine carboxypeptidase/D-alanyl-D-alanine-endopeptidase [Shimia sp. R10_1]